jgi:transposase-like protein
MLSNRRYIGEYSFQDITIPNGIPTIIPQDLFDRVQERLAKNKKAPARAKAQESYLLTTKLFCGHCGTSMNGESGKSRNGTIHRYYKCHAVKKKLNDCKKKPVKKEWIEDLVINETMAMLMDDDMIEAIVSMLMRLQDEESTDLPIYEKQLRETETAIDNIVNAIMSGLASKALQSKLTDLEARKVELETLIAEEKLEKPKIPAEFMTFWLHKFRQLDMAQEKHRQMLVDTFVNAIFVYDDKLLLTFNFKDGTRTITLADVEAAANESGSDLEMFGVPKIKRRHKPPLYFFRQWDSKI